MLRRDGLLGFALRDLVGFRGYERDELDAAVYEQISGVSRESNAGFGIIRGKDFGDNFLHGCCKENIGVSKLFNRETRAAPEHGGTQGLQRGSPFGKERSSLPMYLSAMIDV